MFCLDVKSVCPSVPRKEDREACTIALENRSNISIPTEDILKMLDLVLENNNFCFNGSHNLLTEGTAIASHLGMNYACTFLRVNIDAYLFFVCIDLFLSSHFLK
jgi:hypothetical protein